MRWAAPLLISCGLTACGGPGSGGLVPEPLEPLEGREGLSGQLLQVADFQQPCRSEAGALGSCLMVRGEGEDGWREQFGPVIGFTPAWGIRSLLDVEVNEVGSEEAPETEVVLLAGIEDEPQAEQVFALKLASEFLSGGARLLGGREFDCAELDLCGDLDERLAVGDRFDAYFQHPEAEAEDDPLILVGLPSS